MQPCCGMWKKILCAVDFSPGSREALFVAAQQAGNSGGELLVAHAWSPPMIYVGEMIGLPSTILADAVAAAERELAAMKTEAAGHGARRVRTMLLTGTPWHEVVVAAKDAGVELLVVGTHGRTGLKHALLGSVAEKIVRHSPCAVLVIPPKH
jgi:universal stress protein A